MLVPGI
jgi:hypothetical protein